MTFELSKTGFVPREFYKFIVANCRGINSMLPESLFLPLVTYVLSTFQVIPYRQDFLIRWLIRFLIRGSRSNFVCIFPKLCNSHEIGMLNRNQKKGFQTTTDVVKI